MGKNGRKVETLIAAGRHDEDEVGRKWERGITPPAASEASVGAVGRRA